MARQLKRIRLSQAVEMAKLLDQANQDDPLLTPEELFSMIGVGFDELSNNKPASYVEEWYVRMAAEHGWPWTFSEFTRMRGGVRSSHTRASNGGASDTKTPLTGTPAPAAVAAVKPAVTGTTATPPAAPAASKSQK